MTIHIECQANRSTHVNVHRIEPKIVDLSNEHNPLYVLHHGGDTTYAAISVFFDDKQLMALRHQIDEMLEKKRARVTLAGLAAAAVAPEVSST